MPHAGAITAYPASTRPGDPHSPPAPPGCGEAALRVLERLPAVVWATDARLRPTWGPVPGRGPLGPPAPEPGAFADGRAPDSPQLDAHRRALRGEPTCFDARWQGRDYRVLVEPVRAPDGSVSGCLGVAVDVSKQGVAGPAGAGPGAERPCNTSHCHAADRLPFEQDLAGVLHATADGRIIECNDALARTLGLPGRANAVGQRLTAFFADPADCEALAAELQRTGAVTNRELKVRRPDGETAWVMVSLGRARDARGADYLRGAVIDVSDRKRAEAQVHFQASLLEQVPNAVIVTDPAGALLYRNRRAEALFGRLTAEVGDRPVWEALVPEAGRDDRRQALAVAGRDGVWEGEMRACRADGTQFPVHVVDAALRDEAGRPAGVVSVCTDITGRKRLEEQYRQAQKMDALGRLAGGVAHDFNNLLTVINGYAELLLSRTPRHEPAFAMVREVAGAGDRAAALTRQLLAFSRQAVVEPKLLDLRAAVADAERLLGRVIGEDIALTLAADPDLRCVRLDPGQLTQVLMNLAVNARDAMPAGGKLTIELRNVRLDETYTRTHAGVRPGRYVLLAVSDTGSGMTPEVRGRVWEPFFTTKEAGKGTGLGLAVVHGIVTQADGSTEVYSEPGLGTTFKLYFPASSERPASRPSTHGELLLERGSETVLVAEDEEGVRQFAGAVLRACGYTVLEASDGDEAIKLAQAYVGAIGLLLTDVVMPGAGGREVAHQVTASRPGTKVLYLSGYPDDAVVRHGILEHEVAFLQKPYRPAALARKVREVLDGA